MPTNRASPTPWREKRRARGRSYDIKKKAKAERERFRRGRRAVCKKAHNLYLDGLDTGRERRAYVLFFEKSKGRNGQGRYFTYNSHPDIAWIPHAEEVAENYPPTESITPEDFKNTSDPRRGKETMSMHVAAKKPCRRLFTISQPPLLTVASNTGSSGSTTGSSP